MFHIDERWPQPSSLYWSHGAILTWMRFHSAALTLRVIIKQRVLSDRGCGQLLQSPLDDFLICERGNLFSFLCPIEKQWQTWGLFARRVFTLLTSDLPEKWTEVIYFLLGKQKTAYEYFKQAYFTSIKFSSEYYNLLKLNRQRLIEVQVYFHF